MKPTYKFAAGVITSIGLGIARATAYAHPGQMGGGLGPQSKGGMQHGTQGGMQHGKGGMQHGSHGGMQNSGMSGCAQGHGAGQQLMTPEERTALRERMRNATPEERQQIATTTHAEMQKRAQAKGITLPEGRGPRTSAAPQPPAETEHQH